MTSSVYDNDTLLWVEQQATLLRAGQFDELDYEHILEELEDMGREQKVALQSLFRQILIHLLKLDYSPAIAPRGKWVDELVEFRAQAQTRLEQTPSLKHYANDLFEKAWQQASRGAYKSFEAYGEVVEIPRVCPYQLAECLDVDFVPRGRS
ncbi:MAG: DUF29 domain-containing protein [Lamprobacter sp.]|uniref:DUF29 domain-containing protein n=1 Tax=Lamprobacter sp. TaxID=3100796 RepID=UPI002B258A45|nr:DUF29 domain-containing protein [Lamprobacter sp.]MEA3638499.1 DUF29 domain-containing protein [Lamprobacter sp.]